MLKFFFIVLFSTLSTFAINVDAKSTYNELLSHSKIYIDYNKSSTIDTIQNQKFKAIKQQVLGLDYSPDFVVWIKFRLTNTSKKKIEKIIEYDNPLTSSVLFFEGTDLLKEDGLLYASINQEGLHPICKISFKAHESKIFYIKVSSKITTMILKLNLWNTDTFYKKEMKHQFVLALFFGAIALLILYNFILFFATRQRSYLYYVLAFIGIAFHHLLYKGVAKLYLFSAETIQYLIEYSAFIVAFPVFFLALFTQSILKLDAYPRINTSLNILLILFVTLTAILFYFDMNSMRSPLVLLLLLFLAWITLYTYIKKKNEAKFLLRTTR